MAAKAKMNSLEAVVSMRETARIGTIMSRG